MKSEKDEPSFRTGLQTNTGISGRPTLTVEYQRSAGRVTKVIEIDHLSAEQARFVSFFLKKDFGIK